MMTQEVEVRLAIICPQPLITYGLARMFEDDSRLNIVQETSSLADLEQLLTTAKPDVTLIDWDLMSQSPEAIELIRRTSGSTEILFLMQIPGPRDCRVALEIGARGVLAKTSPAATIRKAVWKVSKGGIWVDRAAAEAVLEYALSPSSPLEIDRRRIEWLTRRERQIVELVCRGYRNKRIALELRIAETTVCHHLSSVFSKLEVEDRMALLVFAHRHSLNITLNNHANPHFRERLARNPRVPALAKKSHIAIAESVVPEAHCPTA